ncbi:hypothetical protein ACFL6M_05715, partial [Candidatus Eisenbacteria bacterium]
AVQPYRELSDTYGSDVRDLAMILETLILLGDYQRAKPIADEVAEALSSGWHSTQTTAYALLSIARFATQSGTSDRLQFKYGVDADTMTVVFTDKPMVCIEQSHIDTGGHRLVLTNTSEGMLFARLIMTGIPPIGTERPSSNGMQIDVDYLDMDGEPINPGRIEQGTDFQARVNLTHTGRRASYDEVALSQIFPSGWEIHNERLDPSQQETNKDVEYRDIRDDRVYSYFDLKRRRAMVITTMLHATYGGRFYLPMVEAEAMYDATINARVMGQWVEVVPAREEQ